MIVPQTKITSEYSISKVIKGGWQLAGGHGAINPRTAIEDMFTFVEAGITTFDCADIYIGVEELIGEFRAKYVSKFGPQQLSKIKVHTKFVPDRDKLPNITKKYVESIIDRSLKRLNVQQLDLVQFHWWDYEVPMYLEAGQYLKELQAKGKIKNIGVTNFDVPRLSQLVEAGIPIVSNQTQYSVLDHRVENGMVAFCQHHDIKLLCYGSLAGGFLSQRYIGQVEPRAPLENRSLVKYKLIIDDFGGWELFQALLSILKKIADKYNVDLSNVALKYVLDRPQVSAVIVGARNTDHLKNLGNTFRFCFDDEDQRMLEAIFCQIRGPLGDTYDLERQKNSKHALIMKYNLNKE